MTRPCRLLYCVCMYVPNRALPMLSRGQSHPHRSISRKLGQVYHQHHLSSIEVGDKGQACSGNDGDVEAHHIQWRA